MGRKALPPGRRKDGQVSIRLTLAEEEALRFEASKVGLRPAAWANLVIKAKLGVVCFRCAIEGRTGCPDCMASVEVL